MVNTTLLFRLGGYQTSISFFALIKKMLFIISRNTRSKKSEIFVDLNRYVFYDWPTNNPMFTWMTILFNNTNINITVINQFFETFQFRWISQQIKPGTFLINGWRIFVGRTKIKFNNQEWDFFYVSLHWYEINIEINGYNFYRLKSTGRPII